MTIRAIVVDDEPPSRANVTALLRPHDEIELVAECGSGVEALEAIASLRPELLFLDVQMPELDGFDVLEMLGPGAPAAIVFVTAYDMYAIAAFDAGALDYLLKPFDEARFEKALARAKERIAMAHAPELGRTIAIKSIGGVAFVKIEDIDWIEAANYYSRLHVGGATHLLRRRMADLEKDLQPYSFERIHRSTIVNLDRISKLNVAEDGELEVVLEDETAHRLSRSHRRALLAKLENITFRPQPYPPAK
jgi:two-component system LytT family response regulator